MFHYRLSIPKIIPALALFLFLPLTTQSQDALTYSGPFQVKQYTGEADFSYKILEGDTVLDGAFLMQRSSLNALLENEDQSFLFKGTFKDNYPNGKWRFQFGEYKSEKESRVVDYQYRVLVSGTQEEAQGKILMGKPDGEWTYVINRIVESEVDTVLFKSTIDFKNGVPQRNFRIESMNSILVGRFLRNGLAHDEWSLFSTDGLGNSETWIFNNGELREIKVDEEGQIRNIKVFGRMDRSKVINLDSRYISTIGLHKPITDRTTARIEGKMPDMLAKNAQYYNKIQIILSELGESDFLPEFKVKVPHFPLDSLEIQQLNSIEKLYKSSKKISDSLLNNTLLNIVKRSDNEAHYLYAVLEAISEELLTPMGRMLSYRDQDILEFTSREGLMEHLWPQGIPPTTVTPVKENDSLAQPKTFDLVRDSKLDFTANKMASLEKLAQQLAGSLDSIQRQLSSKLATEQRQNEIVSLEEKMVAESNRLEKYIDSVSPEIKATYRNPLIQIKTIAERELSNYAKIKDIKTKRQTAKTLSDCLPQMNLLAKGVASLPSRIEEIRITYEDAVWNPFTATLMNEEVKKRITTAYRKVLVPYFLERITSDFTCSDAGEINELLENTHRRMLEVRKEDTSKLERKLKKQRNPQTVLQLLNIQTESED